MTGCVECAGQGSVRGAGWGGRGVGGRGVVCTYIYVGGRGWGGVQALVHLFLNIN